MKAFIHATVYDFDTYIEDAYILFDESIHSVGLMKDFINQGVEIIDVKHAVVMPSLVVGHTHIYSAFARGMSVPFHPTNFVELLEQLWWKLDRNLSNQMNYYSGIVASVDYMKHGVTTIIDHHASGVDIKDSLNTLKQAVCLDSGLRGIFAFETSDRFDVDSCIKENSAFMDENKSTFSRGLFGLHASLSLSNATLKRVKEVLRKNPIHIHVAESEMDQTDSLEKYKKRVVHRLHAAGLLHKNSILSHAIFVDDSELSVIKKQECVVAVNVTSNMNNGVGLPNMEAMKRHGIPMIIGNDGISSSITPEYLAIYYTSHLHALSPISFGFGDLIQMIQDTYHYAGEMLGVKLGKIQSGYASDFLVMPYTPPTPLHKDNMFGHLFFGMFHAFVPKDVLVAGSYVVKNYEVSKKLEQKYKEAQAVAKTLWENIKKENEYES